MTAWASFAGLGLTGFGIVLGFYRPTIVARYSDESTEAREQRLQMRFIISVALVLIGTGLQMYAAWPP